MLEAVNSVLQTSQLTRSTVEQVSTAESYAANPEKIQKVAQAPFVSPYIHVDVDQNRAVLQIRDSDTGDVLTEYPSKTSLHQRTQAQAEVTATASVQQQPASTDSGSATTGAQSPGQATQTTAAPQEAQGNAATARQLAAFSAAAQSGNSNAGNVTLFA